VKLKNETGKKKGRDEKSQVKGNQTIALMKERKGQEESSILSLKRKAS